MKLSSFVSGRLGTWDMRAPTRLEAAWNGKVAARRTCRVCRPRRLSEPSERLVTVSPTTAAFNFGCAPGDPVRRRAVPGAAVTRSARRPMVGNAPTLVPAGMVIGSSPITVETEVPEVSPSAVSVMVHSVPADSPVEGSEWCQRWSRRIRQCPGSGRCCG